MKKRKGCFEPSDEYDGVGIELNNVCFSYPNSDKLVLNRLSLKIEPGEKICIAGGNGQGKTTLISLLSGLFKNYDGSILIDGNPLKNLDITSLRSVIGDNLNHQDLFRGTLLENITVGKADVPIEDVNWAIELVGLKDYFKNLSDGWNSEIYPEGSQLPTSIKQKIILARTFAERPRIVVVDDNFNTLMDEDKLRITSKLTAKDSKWTLLAVSNDPQLQRRCDKVVYLEDGRIQSVFSNKSDN